MSRTAPIPPTEAPGLYITSALFNAQVRDLNLFALNTPLWSGYLSTQTAVANNTWSHLIIDTEVIDTDGGHSTTSNSQRYTAQVAGVYECNGTVVFGPGGTGLRGAKFLVNGTTEVPGSEQLQAPGSSVATTIPATQTYIRLAVGDYVELCAFQNSGATINTVSPAGGFACQWSARWVSV